MRKVFAAEGIETEQIEIGTSAVHGCIACRSCKKTGHCVFDDDLVSEAARLFREADGLVVGSPVYYASPNGSLIALMDRLMYSTDFPKQMKVGAAVVSCRRSGANASLDVLNKYFAFANMPIAPSTNWNIVHGFTAEDVRKDLEGLQTVRNPARNMASSSAPSKAPAARMVCPPWKKAHPQAFRTDYKERRGAAGRLPFSFARQSRIRSLRFHFPVKKI